MEQRHDPIRDAVTAQGAALASGYASNNQYNPFIQQGDTANAVRPTVRDLVETVTSLAVEMRNRAQERYQSNFGPLPPSPVPIGLGAGPRLDGPPTLDSQLIHARDALTEAIRLGNMLDQRL